MRNVDRRDYLKGFLLASMAGLLWSFGSLIVRYMVAAQSYQWQYLFFRGLTIAVVLLVYILAKEGIDLVDRIKRIGFSSWCVAWEAIKFRQRCVLQLRLGRFHISLGRKGVSVG